MDTEKQADFESALRDLWPHVTGYCFEGATPKCFAEMRTIIASALPDLPNADVELTASARLSRRNPALHNCPCRVPSCICMMNVSRPSTLCDFCIVGSHINSDARHFEFTGDGDAVFVSCPKGCADHA